MFGIPMTMDDINAATAAFFAIPAVVPMASLIIGLGLAGFFVSVLYRIFWRE